MNIDTDEYFISGLPENGGFDIEWAGERARADDFSRGLPHRDGESG